MIDLYCQPNVDNRQLIHIIGGMCLVGEGF